ncbi:hypothetical protein AVEN_203566-1 [Araneus ventricosus]|uniref:Uncharacterized protein n=1 Tax=Araneus ventricosus TaxID=182803 RepID=A0A4Y2FPS5_ARAVE|nr:hypothetical protein AVEN_203566-1 [Araneus ventricosus]
MKFLEHGKEKTYRQGILIPYHIIIFTLHNRNLSNLEQMIRNDGIQKSLKSKIHSADSNLRPRCDGSGKTKDLPTLARRVEARNETRNSRVEEEESGWQEFCDFEPCLKTNFGTSVNALLIFLLKWVRKKTSLRTNDIASLLVNAQLNKIIQEGKKPVL